MPYNDLVLGICINADKYDEVEQVPPVGADLDARSEDHTPFDVSILSQYDFRLRPTNLKIGFKSLRKSKGLDWDDISLW